MKHFCSLLLFLILALPGRAQTTTLTFTPRAPLPDGGRYGMGYCQDGTYFYMVGGGSPLTAFTSEVFRYNPATDSWGSGALSNGQLTPHRLGSAVIIEPTATNKLIYVLNAGTNAGPLPTMTRMQVATSTPTTELGNPLPSTTAATAVWNGRLYTYGGLLANGTYTDQLRSYNPATNTWTTLAPMPEAKNTFGAAVNGKLYAIGGYNGSVNSARVDVYDIATNQWQALAPLPTTVSNQAVAVQGEWIWMIGDFTNQTFLAAYNTRTQQLRTFTSNLPGRRNAAAAIHNGQLYVWGGNTAASNASALSDLWSVNISSVLASAESRAARPQLTAYPNPSAGGEFTLILPTGTGRVVEVRDALGRLVHTGAPRAQATQYLVPLQAQPSGMYSVRVRSDQGLSSSYQLLRR